MRSIVFSVVFYLFMSPSSLADDTTNTHAQQVSDVGRDFAVLRVGQNAEFTTIQAAIDASSPHRRAVILVADGIYRETLYISRNHLAIIGESAQNTLIENRILRKHWREHHPTDWGAAVVNINGADISLLNVTVRNHYGREHGTSEHQFAVRGFENSDRIILKNCRLIADGDDTLSLWNKQGRYYHSHCYFEGYTDMVCPRGTALIEHSTFYNKKPSATLWHDGERHVDNKLVVNHSSFDGVEGFWLGRHHYDAQFYLLNSTFSHHIADKPIFRKRYPEQPQRERPNRYGERYFFENIEAPPKIGWAQDNFKLSYYVPALYPTLEAWVFDNRWFPSQTLLELEEIAAEHHHGSNVKSKLSGIRQ